MRHAGIPTLILILLPANLICQEVTRQDELRTLRESKSRKPRPTTENPAERFLLWMQEKKVREKLETPGAGYKGFRPKLGGLSTGSGFAAGVQFDKPRIWKERLDFSFSSAVSMRQYHYHDMRFDLPRLAGEKAFLSTHLRYRNMPQEDFFGLGPDSRRTDRTDYLYEDMMYEVSAGFRPIPYLQVGTGIAWIDTNVGPGTDRRFANTETVFSNSNAPGLDEQSGFLRTRVFAAFDTRDAPLNPRRGGVYRVGFVNYDDRQLNRFDFRRFETEVQQYVPFNEGHRGIAFRFLGSFDSERKGHQVPFYMQQTLGGSGDLRGYREFRFRDLNRVVFNLEYRWEAWIGLDMALFADAGKVFRKRADFSLDDMEADFGISFRFNTAKAVFWRIDIGHSHEGTRFFIKFDPVFEEQNRWR